MTASGEPGDPDRPGEPASRTVLAQVLTELQALWRITREAVAALWQVVRAPLAGALNVIAALIVLFEEWGWRPLADLLGVIARLRIFARLELWIAGLSPYAALLVFALPTTILLPVKLVGLWLLAKGQAVAAAGVLVLAKIVSTALIARIFMLTKPALMRIAWFAWAYGKFIPWKEAIFARIRASWAWRYGRMVKTTIRHEAKQAWIRWKPQLLAWTATLRDSIRSASQRVRLAARQFLAALRGRTSD